MTIKQISQYPNVETPEVTDLMLLEREDGTFAHTAAGNFKGDQGEQGDQGEPGSATSNSTVAYSGTITPTQITADQNNYAPTGNTTATVWRLSSDAARTLTGISANSVAGRILVLRNVGSFDISLLNSSASSLSIHRFAFPDNVILRPGGADVVLQYDSTASRWRLYAAAFQEGHTEPETTIAAAGTTDVGTSRTKRVAVSASGNPTITSFGTRAKQERLVRFTGACTLTHGAALSLIGGTTRNIVAGDTGVYASDGSGNWAELSFTGYATLSTLAAAVVDIAAMGAVVEAIPVQAAPDTIDWDGAASVVRTVNGSEIQRIDGNGEVFTPGSEGGPVAWFDSDTEEVKAIGGALDGVQVLLSGDLAASIKANAGYTRVQGGFRAPFEFIGGGAHVGRIGRGGVLVPDNGRTIYVFIFMGQSNMGGGAGDLLRTTHPFPQRLLIPQTNDPADIRLFLNQLGAEAIASEDIVGFTSLVGARTYPGTSDSLGTCQSEIALSTFSRLVGEACDDWTPLVCGFTCWKGGTPVSEMEEGGVSNVNQNVRAVGAALVREAAKLGHKVCFLAVIPDQGENDTGNATLADQWVDIVSGLNSYLKPLSGQANDIIPLITQTSSFSTSTGERSKMIRYRASGDLIVAAPRYMIGAEAWNPDDYLHMTNVGHFRLGEAVGHALFWHFCKGGFVPLYVLHARMASGATQLTLTLSEEPAYNDELVAAFTQAGFFLRKSSSPSSDYVAITDIDVVGSTLVLTLGEALSSGTSPAPFLGMGITGQNSPRDAVGINRTNICSALELGRSQLDGRPINKWLPHDSLIVEYV